MKLVSFNFTKIDVEKFSDNLKGLKITTGIDISEVKEVKADIFKLKEELIGISFSYNISYDEKIARLHFKGHMVLAIESGLLKETLKQWKEKKLPEELRLAIFNIILKKVSLKAIQFEEEFNLPLHFPLPSIKNPDKK